MAGVKRSKRMAVVVDISQRELNELAEHLGKQQSQLEQEHQKLQQLNEYNNEYVESLKAVRHTHVQAIQRQRSFIERMNLACKQQQGMIDQLQSHCDTTLERWNLQSQKTKKLEELVERYQHEEQQQQDKAEQNQIDDLVTQRISQRISSSE